MRIKVDENIGRSGVCLLRENGHDVLSVRDQQLIGAADEVVFQACVEEARNLIALDRDFGQVPRFPPDQTAGIVILEIGGPGSLDLLHDRRRDFLAIAATRSVSGELWIVEPRRVRVHLKKHE